MIWILGSCVIISLVYWHIGNYACHMVLVLYGAFDRYPVGNYFWAAAP